MMVGLGIKLVYDTGLPLVFIGMLGVIAVMWLWFRDVVIESQGGLYDAQMDRSFRWGMGWFIFSEVMFFAAFFGALFYVRMFAVPWLGGEGAKGVSALLWPDFVAQWPLLTPPDASIAGPQQVFSPWQLPLVNTLILITSSITLTVAHEALKEGYRKTCRNWLAGTGFHGVHVIVGTLILATILVRIHKGHFAHENHFGFEASCWYWHFVDVVWVGLFIFVYVL